MASVLGARVSGIYVAITLLLMAPSLRVIHVAPLLAIIAAHAFLVIILVPVSKILFVIATYSLFRLMHERTKLFAQVLFAILGVAIFVSILQFMIPSRLLNFHATAVSSPNNWLDRVRPTSIFPAQVYFNQLLLLALSILLLARVSSKSIIVMFGVGCAICGSTAGVLSFLLALFIIQRFRWILAASFLLTIAFAAVYYPDAVLYNYSISDIVASLKTRLNPVYVDLSGAQISNLAKDGTAVTMVKVMAEHPTVALVVQFLAMTGVMLGIFVVLNTRPKLTDLIALAAAIAGMLAAQILHATQGSLFSCLFVGMAGAICWRLVRGYPWQEQSST